MPCLLPLFLCSLPVPWLISGDMTRFAEVLVVASPCPLILAAPIAFVGGMSRSSRNGLLVKMGQRLKNYHLLKPLPLTKQEL